LYHKKRGGKGEWKEVSEGEMLRVTKKVGKKMKLVFCTPIPIRLEQIQLLLIDSTSYSVKSDSPGEQNEGDEQVASSVHFTIENSAFKKEFDRHVAELHLKIYSLSKGLSFHFDILPPTAPTNALPLFQGKTIVFGTHNSGKQSKCVMYLNGASSFDLRPFPITERKKGKQPRPPAPQRTIEMTIQTKKI